MNRTTTRFPKRRGVGELSRRRSLPGMLPDELSLTPEDFPPGSDTPLEAWKIEDVATMPCDELADLVAEAKADGVIPVVRDPMLPNGQMTVEKFRNGCWGGHDWKQPHDGNGDSLPDDPGQPPAPPPGDVSRAGLAIGGVVVGTIVVAAFAGLPKGWPWR